MGRSACGASSLTRVSTPFPGATPTRASSPPSARETGERHVLFPRRRWSACRRLARVSLALEAFGGENSTKARYGGMATSDATPNAPFSMFDPGRAPPGRAGFPPPGTRTAPWYRRRRRAERRAGRVSPEAEDTRGLPVDALAFAFGDAAAAAAERRVAAWRVALAESESATRAGEPAARRADVRHRFPRSFLSQRRAYNGAKYAERMAPRSSETRAVLERWSRATGMARRRARRTTSAPNETSERETEL